MDFVKLLLILQVAYYANVRFVSCICHPHACFIWKWWPAPHFELKACCNDAQVIEGTDAWCGIGKYRMVFAILVKELISCTL